MSEHGHNGDTSGEQKTEELEPTTENVVQKARQLIADNTDKATFGTYMEYGSKEVKLRTKDGRMLTIEEVLPGRATEGYALQDISIWIERGSSDMTESEVHFNYNQYGDGLMRKRVFNDVASDHDAPSTSTATSDEELVALTHELIHRVDEGIENKALEEQMGIDNQPVTDDDLKELLPLLDEGEVLDPRLV